MKALAVVAALAGAAHADKGPPDPKPSAPDPLAQQEADEANLEPNGPRDGFAISFAVGGATIIGDGVGRGGSFSARLGHVATPDSIATAEITIGTMFHKPSGSSSLLHNDSGSVMVGMLHYVNPSFWVRGAAGLNIYSVQEPDIAMPMNAKTTAHPGGGVLGGVGLDLVRRHYFVFGIESFTVVSVVASKGLMATGGLMLGLSYY